MAVVEIAAVRAATRNQALIRAFAVDAPAAGTACDFDRFTLDGWVLGKDERATAIEVGLEDGKVRLIPVALFRPDVAADFPDIALAELSGFHGSVPVTGLDADFSVEIRAVFADGRRVALATILGRRHPRAENPHATPSWRHASAAASMTRDEESGIAEKDGVDPLERDWPRFDLDEPRDHDELAVGKAVAGWAFSPVGMQDISLWLDNELLGLAIQGSERPDVGNDRPDWPGASRSGFRYSLETLPGSLFPREAQLKVVAEDWLGRQAALTRTVRLVEPGLPSAAGSLDVPEERDPNDPLASAGWSSPLVVRGWAVDLAGVDRVDVLIDGHAVAVAEYGSPREDVDGQRPEYRRLGLTAHSGWLAVVPTDGFPDGEHTVSAILRGGSGSLPLGQSRVLLRNESIRADPSRQRRLETLLRCPHCGRELIRDGDGLICESCGAVIPANEFGTLLFDETYGGLDWRQAGLTSQGYPPRAREIIQKCGDALVLEVGGGLHESLSNVIQLDAIAYPTTDVCANGEDMPFADESFDAVIACALLEHVATPANVVAEMRRVCKIGGRLYADSTTVHPYHGFPHHYFNATESGLDWLMREVGGATGIVEPEDARATIRLVVEGWLASMEDDRTREIVTRMPTGDLIALLDDPESNPELYGALNNLSPLGQRLIPPKVMFSGIRAR